MNQRSPGLALCPEGGAQLASSPGRSLPSAGNGHGLGELSDCASSLFW